MNKTTSKDEKLKALYYGFLIAFQIGSFTGLAQDDPRILDEIVAKINDEIVTLTDLNVAFAERQLELRQETGDSAEMEKRFEAEKVFLLKSYIHTRLMLQKAEELWNARWKDTPPLYTVNSFLAFSG